MKIGRLILLASVVLAAFSVTAAAEDGPKETVEKISKGLSEGNTKVLWDALPKSYQDDINRVVRSAASQLEADIYNKTFTVLRKAANVLKTKKDLILGYPLLAAMVPDRAGLEKNWDEAVSMIELLASSEISNLENLRKIDVGSWVGTTGSAFMKKATAVASAAPTAPGETNFMETLKGVQVEVLSIEGDLAKVRMTAPGEEPEEEEMLRVEGKWLPKEMVEGWKESIASAEADIAQMSNEESKAANKAMAMGMLTMVEMTLDQIAAAKNAVEFNQIVGGIMEQFMGEGG